LGNSAGRLLMTELERILREFKGVLDVVGQGLHILEEKTREEINGHDLQEE